MCFLHIMKTISEETLIAYWQRAPSPEVSDFFSILEVCLQNFRYLGKRNIIRKIAAAFKFVQSTQNNGTLKGSNPSCQTSGLLPQWMHTTSSHESQKQHRSQTLPIIRGKNALSNPKLLQMLDNTMTSNSNEIDIVHHVDTEANVATEVCLTILDLLALFTQVHQRQLQQSECQNSTMKRVFDTYMLFFQVNQSATALKHVFASLRLFVCKFPSAFFQGPADLCGSFCYEVLKCCNHRSRSTQTEASALLYFFMRKNFEFNKQKSIVRSHLQVSAVDFHSCCSNHSSVSASIKACCSQGNRLPTPPSDSSLKALSLSMPRHRKRAAGQKPAEPMTPLVLFPSSAKESKSDRLHNL